MLNLQKDDYVPLAADIFPTPRTITHVKDLLRAAFVPLTPAPEGLAHIFTPSLFGIRLAHTLLEYHSLSMDLPGGVLSRYVASSVDRGLWQYSDSASQMVLLAPMLQLMLAWWGAVSQSRQPTHQTMLYLGWRMNDNVMDLVRCNRTAPFVSINSEEGRTFIAAQQTMRAQQKQMPLSWENKPYSRMLYALRTCGCCGIQFDVGNPTQLNIHQQQHAYKTCLAMFLPSPDGGKKDLFVEPHLVSIPQTPYQYAPYHSVLPNHGLDILSPSSSSSSSPDASFRVPRYWHDLDPTWPQKMTSHGYTIPISLRPEKQTPVQRDIVDYVVNSLVRDLNDGALYEITVLGIHAIIHPLKWLLHVGTCLSKTACTEFNKESGDAKQTGASAFTVRSWHGTASQSAFKSIAQNGFSQLYTTTFVHGMGCYSACPSREPIAKYGQAHVSNNVKTHDGEVHDDVVTVLMCQCVTGARYGSATQYQNRQVQVLSYRFARLYLFTRC